MILVSNRMTLIFLELICLTHCLFGQTTLRNTEILTRKKRYLGFPKGANLVYTLVYVKILMKKVPKNVQFFHEFDVPHPLPPDTTLFQKFKHGHRVHRRQLCEDIAIALDRYGLNGTACVNRMVCEAKQFIPFKGKSLVKDMLSEVFLGHDGLETGGDFFEDSCEHFLVEQCPHPLLDLMWGSFTNY